MPTDIFVKNMFKHVTFSYHLTPSNYLKYSKHVPAEHADGTTAEIDERFFWSFCQ